MNRLFLILLCLNLAMPPCWAQNFNRYYPDQRYYNTGPNQRYPGLQDPIYHTNFRLYGSAHVDRKAAEVAGAASEAYRALSQFSSNMSSCLMFNQQQEQRLQHDYQVMRKTPQGAAAVAKFQQVESIVRQAKAEFEAYNAKNRHDGNDPDYKSGNAHLDQAQKLLRGEKSTIDKLWAAVNMLAQGAGQVANIIGRQDQPNDSNNNGTNNNNYPPVIPPYQGSNTTPYNQDPNQGDQPVNYQRPSDRPNHPTVDRRLRAYAQALQNRASREISDPATRAQIIRDLQQKFIGIGRGLNNSKEKVKQSGIAAFNGVVRTTEAFRRNPQGTLDAAKEAAIAFGIDLANKTEQALEAAAQDSHAFDRVLKGTVSKVVNQVGQGLENYSKLPPLQQGEVLGDFMFWGFNPAGSLEGANVAGQALTRATNVLRPHATQLGAELKALANAAGQKLAAGKAKLAAQASKWVPKQRYAIPGGVTMTDEELYMAMSGRKGGGGNSLPGKGGNPGVISGELTASKLAAHPTMQRVLQQAAITGTITAEAGQEVANLIRESLKGTIRGINDKNIAVGVLKLDGKTEVLYSISGSNMPGTAAPVNPLFKTIPSGAMPRNLDSEYKILEAVAQKIDANPNSKFSLSIFSELKPCNPSCQGVIEQFRGRYAGRFEGTGFPRVSFRFNVNKEKQLYINGGH